MGKIFGYASYDYFDKMFNIAYLYSNEKHRGSSFPREYVGYLINKSIDEFLKFVENANNDLAYCVLGYLIIKNGADMTEDIRKLIISSCENLIDENDTFPLFKENLISYRSGQMKDLPYLHSLYLFYL